MFPRNAWYVASWSDDLVARPLARRICNEPIVLYRDANGRACALVDRCCHRGAPLSAGRVTHEGLECGYHGLVFAGDGECVRVPGQDRPPKTARVRSYPLVERDGLVWLWPGDPAAADPTLILDYPYHADLAHWPHKHDLLPIRADYMLVIDNLMDLTHLGYVHGGTIGGDPKAHVEAKMQSTPTPRGLRFTRWMLDSQPPPTYTKAVPFRGAVDRWQEFEYVAPGAVLQWSGAVDAGRGAYERGHRDGGIHLRLFHAVTPETESSCFYFWSSANGYRQSDPAATEQLFEEISAAFAQDKAIVELQQARLAELGEEGLVNIKNDGARLHMRRVVEQMIESESATATD
jgi:vanillate O-demethylase monooxygenase subunit